MYEYVNLYSYCLLSTPLRISKNKYPRIWALSWDSFIIYTGTGGETAEAGWLWGGEEGIEVRLVSDEYADPCICKSMSSAKTWGVPQSSARYCVCSLTCAFAQVDVEMLTKGTPSFNTCSCFPLACGHWHCFNVSYLQHQQVDNGGCLDWHWFLVDVVRVLPLTPFVVLKTRKSWCLIL